MVVETPPLLAISRSRPQSRLRRAHGGGPFPIRLWILNIVDDVTKEFLGAIPDTSISGGRVRRDCRATRQTVAGVWYFRGCSLAARDQPL